VTHEADPGSAHPRDRLKRALGLRDATFLVVSAVIGSGIFLTPGRIAELVPHPGVILAVWAFGGLLSLVGALANAELAAMFPRAGGNYVYLREAYHPLAGFLVGWLGFFAIYAGTVATLAAGFAGSLAVFVPLSTGAQLAIAVGLIAALSALNYVGVRFGAHANNITAVLKVLALLAFAVLGPLWGQGDWSNLQPLVSGASAISLTALGLALSPVLFSYLGWNSSVYVASEIRDPQRNVPRSLMTGLFVCTAVYLLVNAVYLYALPVPLLTGEANAGEAAASALFGAGGGLVGGFVLLSILGTLNATVLVGPRIAYAMALDGLFFSGVDQAQARFQTPARAIVLQGATAIGILLFLRTFPSALDFTTFAIVIATIADAGALLTLRRRQPDRPRAYRAWGHPWLPIGYIAIHLGIGAALLWGRSAESILLLVFLASGLPFYWYFARRLARA